jgi:hypothetical protein
MRGADGRISCKRCPALANGAAAEFHAQLTAVNDAIDKMLVTLQKFSKL